MISCTICFYKCQYFEEEKCQDTGAPLLSSLGPAHFNLEKSDQPWCPLVIILFLEQECTEKQYAV